MAPDDTHASLLEDVERLRFVADAVPALIAYVDAEARYVWANESYRRWFGTPPDEIRGRHARDVLGADAWAAIRTYAERALGGEEVTFTHRIVYKNGPHAMSARPTCPIAIRAAGSSVSSG